MIPEIQVKCQGYQTACLEGKQKTETKKLIRKECYVRREENTETEKGNMAVKSNCSYFPYTKRTTKNKPSVPRLCYGCAGGRGKGKRSAGSGGVLLIYD